MNRPDSYKLGDLFIDTQCKNNQVFMITCIDEYEVKNFKAPITYDYSYWLVSTKGNELELYHEELVTLINHDKLEYKEV